MREVARNRQPVGRPVLHDGAQGKASALALAIGRDFKGKVSPLLYALGIGLAFVNRWRSVAIYVTVALM